MPEINADGCPIHVEVEGPERAPVLMLSNSLGTTLHMWDGQLAPFTQHFRLIRYDRRGHGKSGCPKGPYTMERLGSDVLAVLDALGIGKINWCGLSMGGMVGQWLGANAPDRVERGTNQSAGARNPVDFVARIASVLSNLDSTGARIAAIGQLGGLIHYFLAEAVAPGEQSQTACQQQEFFHFAPPERRSMPAILVYCHRSCDSLRLRIKRISATTSNRVPAGIHIIKPPSC